MPLPRPGARPGSGAVKPIPQAQTKVKERAPNLPDDSSGDVFPDQPHEAVESPPLNEAFSRPRGASPVGMDETALPWPEAGSEPAVEEPVRTPTASRRPAPEPEEAELVGDAEADEYAAYEQVAGPPAVQGRGQAMQAHLTHGPMRSLQEMGFDGLDLGAGFGAFPSVTLKDDRFKTSDGEDLGSGFFCVIHSSKPKWIVKSSEDNDAEFVYTNDKQTTSNGRPLNAIYRMWRAQGMLTGEPVFKAYLDVMAQLIDLQTKQAQGIVLLQIPQTSIERFKGHLSSLLVQGLKPAEVITQVGLGAKITSVRHPFWPWAFRRYADVKGLGL